LPRPRGARAWQEPSKILKLNIGGTFWTKFEPILNKILMLTSNCRPQGDNPTLRFCTASASLPPSKTEKFSKHLFNRRPAKIFSIKEKKIFLF
jgi:hypothetical protein